MVGTRLFIDNSTAHCSDSIDMDSRILDSDQLAYAPLELTNKQTAVAQITWSLNAHPMTYQI